MVKLIIENEYIDQIVKDGNWDINEIEYALTQQDYKGDYYISGGNDDRLFAFNPQEYRDTITITGDEIRHGLWLVCELCGKEMNVEDPQYDICPHCFGEY